MAGVDTAKKEASHKQEKEIAKFLGGKVQSGSGGTAFGGGDVHTDTFLIEAKTTTYHRNQIQLREDWLLKMYHQAFEQRKPHAALAVRFDPNGQDFYLISADLMKRLVDMLEREE